MVDWTHTQGAQDSAAGNTSVSFLAAVASGAVVVGAVLLGTGLTLTNVTDDKSNAYTIFESHDDGGLYTAAFRSNGLLTNGPTTLTYTTSAAPGTFWKVQDEFAPPTGATGAVSVDGSSSSFADAGTSFNSFTTTLSDDLVYAVAMVSGTATHGAGFNVAQGDNTARMAEWGIQATAATVTMTTGANGGNFWGPAFGIHVAAVATTKSRKTLSQIGGRVGSRQPQGWGLENGQVNKAVYCERPAILLPNSVERSYRGVDWCDSDSDDFQKWRRVRSTGRCGDRDCKWMVSGSGKCNGYKYVR